MYDESEIFEEVLMTKLMSLTDEVGIEDTNPLCGFIYKVVLQLIFQHQLSQKERLQIFFKYLVIATTSLVDESTKTKEYIKCIAMQLTELYLKQSDHSSPLMTETAIDTINKIRSKSSSHTPTFDYWIKRIFLVYFAVNWC